MNHRKIIRFCAEECKRQQSGELSVADMCDAYQYALNRTWTGWGPRPGLQVLDILQLAALIEPEKNRNGFRKVPVRVPGLIQPPDASSVSGAIENLVNHGLSTLTPEEFYKEFENIHPFVDGNGRVGCIIYNWLKGTLDNPVFPPNFWDRS